MNTEKLKNIQRLNDEHRQKGIYLITQGIQALGNQKVIEILQAVQNYNDFNEDNNPYQERDFGDFELDGDTYIWKIDYYDNNEEFLSPDPSDPKVTKRVLTVMLSYEY